MLDSASGYECLDMTGLDWAITGNIMPKRDAQKDGSWRAMKYEDLLFLKEAYQERLQASYSVVGGGGGGFSSPPRTPKRTPFPEKIPSRLPPFLLFFCWWWFSIFRISRSLQGGCFPLRNSPRQRK